MHTSVWCSLAILIPYTCTPAWTLFRLGVIHVPRIDDAGYEVAQTTTRKAVAGQNGPSLELADGLAWKRS